MSLESFNTPARTSIAAVGGALERCWQNLLSSERHYRNGERPARVSGAVRGLTLAGAQGQPNAGPQAG